MGDLEDDEQDFDGDTCIYCKEPIDPEDEIARSIMFDVIVHADCLNDVDNDGSY